MDCKSSGKGYGVAEVDSPCWKERDFIQFGKGPIAGVDEAGRGPLAGPVTVGIVVFPDRLFVDGDETEVGQIAAEGVTAERVKGLQKLQNLRCSVRDSKELSPSLREEAFAAVRSQAHFFSAVHISSKLIDSWNINRAIEFGIICALRRAHLVGVFPRVLLIDGNYRLPLLEAAFPQVSCHSIIKADRHILTVSAASIVAKVQRDRRMKALGKLFPAYGFEKHKGYPTSQHRKMIGTVGQCPIHRRSYKMAQ